jgi:hypothetical protein
VSGWFVVPGARNSVLVYSFSLRETTVPPKSETLSLSPVPVIAEAVIRFSDGDIGGSNGGFHMTSPPLRKKFIIKVS